MSIDLRHPAPTVSSPVVAPWEAVAAAPATTHRWSTLCWAGLAASFAAGSACAWLFTGDLDQRAVTIAMSLLAVVIASQAAVVGGLVGMLRHGRATHPAAITLIGTVLVPALLLATAWLALVGAYRATDSELLAALINSVLSFAR